MSKDAWAAEFATAPSGTAALGVTPVETVRLLSGLEFLQGIVSGRLPRPPISATLSFHIVRAERGVAVFLGMPRPEHYNPIGSVHGGWASTLLDSCMACAVQTTLDAGKGYTSVELKVNFVRPLLADTGAVRAEGKVISAGNRIATAEGRLIDAGGKLYAHGTTTCLVFPI